MTPADIADLRVLLAREDVIETAAQAAYYAEKPKPLNAWYEVDEGTRQAHKDWVRDQVAAVLELAGALPATDPLTARIRAQERGSRRA